MKRGVVIGLVVFIVIIAAGIYFFNSANYSLNKLFKVSGNVIESGTFEQGEDYEQVLRNFEKDYIEHKEKGEKIYFVFGNQKEFVVASYEEILQGRIGLNFGKTSEQLLLNKEEYNKKTVLTNNNKIEFTLNGKDYSFTLKEGENVYFIIRG